MSAIQPVPNTSPAIRKLVEDAAKYAEANRANSTVRQYTSNFSQFQKFCDTNGFQHLPTTMATLCVYAARMAEDGRSVSTIDSHVAAVKHFHARVRADLNLDDQNFVEVMAGIRRLSGKKIGKAEAILVSDLRQIVADCPASLRGLRDKAMVLTGFSGALRRSELVGIQAEHLDFRAEGVVIFLPRSKTDQNGQGAEVAIPNAADPALCPVKALRAWLEASDISTGPAFRQITKEGSMGSYGLSEEGFRLVLNKLTKNAGLEGDFTPHSLRAGFCTQAAIAGKPLEQISRHARHSSPKTTMGYIRVAEQFTANAGNGLF